ncbi:hypothetical protein AAIH46_12005 [Rhizobium sp. 0TCS1.26]|uniref:hypothetical protein n=1 Tax=Rhizobium sp. 0TCS1.26 TaxID=3142623 RepID=UPI003D28C1CA
MPSLSDLVQHQLAGLWLLVRGDARGLSNFDISDEGVVRSFLAFVICLPAIIVHAVLRRIEFLQVSPDLGRSTITFLFQAMALQTAGWVLSLGCLMLFGLLLGLRPLLRPLVVLMNWAAVPALYLAYGIVYPIAMLPDDSIVFSLLKAALLVGASVGAIVIAWLALRTVVGGSLVRRSALMVLVALPATYIVSMLETSMGLRLPHG